MAWTVEVESEKAAQIEDAAARRGLTPEQFVTAAALREATAAGNGAPVHVSHPTSRPVPPWAEGLRSAAERNDEVGFIIAWRGVDQDALTAEDWELSIRLALQAGAHVQARALAQEGARRYPEEQRLRERARILAPPRLVRTYPADPAEIAARKADNDWMRAHWNEHRGQWVALHNGQLLGTAPTMRELRQQLESAGIALDTKPLMAQIY